MTLLPEYEITMKASATLGPPPAGRSKATGWWKTRPEALRVFTLLHQARPVRLNLGEPGSVDITRGRPLDVDNTSRGRKTSDKSSDYEPKPRRSAPVHAR